MSTAAIRHVLDHFPFGGAKLIVMTALADMSKQRRDPFIADISLIDLAKKCRNSKRAILSTVDDLELLGYIAPEKDSGKTTSYRIQIQYPRPVKNPSRVVKKTTPVVVQKTSPLNREEPKGEPRARSVPQNIIQISHSA